ncbi:MAG TPA: hypothetical protein VJM31_01040 [Vicinamibacterales bacterium]|nr:hypothetical protein [Vicinamibacterales bacterium]
MAKLKSMFRARSWIRQAGVALFVLASLVAGTVAPPHADGQADLACAPLFASHDASAHSVGPASATPHREADHCFLCHSLRSFHPAFEKFEQRDGAVRAERLHATLVVFADRLDWSLAPGRAPPA